MLRRPVFQWQWYRTIDEKALVRTHRTTDFLACRKTQHSALGVPGERKQHGFKELVEREIYGLPAVKNCLGDIRREEGQRNVAAWVPEMSGTLIRNPSIASADWDFLSTT